METQLTQNESTPIKISVVVPVYNDVEYLPTCLDSLINQTLQDIEILLVNDASTDNSLQILNEYAARDSRIRVFSFPENRSAFAARNEGIRNASGEYIMFVDGDDYLELNACEQVWTLEQEHPVDILHFGVNVFKSGDAALNLERYRKHLVPPEGYLYGSEIFASFAQRKLEGHLTFRAFTRAICLKAASINSEDLNLPLSQDKYLYWMIISLASSYRGCPHVTLYNYRRGLGLRGAEDQIDLPIFERYCKLSWTEKAIEEFAQAHPIAGQDMDAVVLLSRRDSLHRCVKNWLYLPEQQRSEGLRLMRQYWTQPGDAGEMTAVLCESEDRSRLVETLDRCFQEERAAKTHQEARPVRTIGTYYHILHNGGIQRVLSLLLKIWKEMGYRVVLITDFASEQDYDIPPDVIRVNCSASAHASLRNYGVRGAEWEKILREYQIDVMVYHNYHEAAMVWDLLTCKLLGVPFLLYYHNVFTKYLIFGDDRFHEIPKTARLSDGLLVLSEVDRIFWRNVAPDLPVFQVDNPPTFDLKDVAPSDLAEPCVVWTGRLDIKHKQFLDVVDIMREVLQQVPDAKLYVLGGDESGENLELLARKVREAGLNQSIVLCGFQKNVRMFYQNASVFLMTASHEGYPMSLQEALIFGLPVVMYELPHLSLVQGNQGIVSVPQKDIKGAAKAICDLLEDRERRREVGRRGRDFVESLYSADRIEAQWRSVFDAIAHPGTISQDRESPAFQLLVRTLLESYRISRLARPAEEQGAQATSAGLNRFRYGNKADQKYAELRTIGKVKQEVAFVTEQGGKTSFHTLLNSDGSRNWVTPEELKRLTKHSSVSAVHRDTLAEVRKALSGQEKGDEWPCIRFTYGDVVKKQQYAELRTSGPKDKRTVSLVTASQQDGQKLFNTLLNSDGSRNWVTPEELRRFMERSEASEMVVALEAKVAELTEQLKQLQTRYESLISNV